MPECTIQTPSGSCGVPIYELGQDKCYVHSMLETKEPISDYHKFIGYARKHRLHNPLFEERYGCVKINFQWNLNQVLNDVFPSGYASLPLMLKNMIFNDVFKCSRRQFSSNFSFINCTFNADAFFREVRFQYQYQGIPAEYSFQNVSFNKIADFRQTIFHNCFFKEVDFSKCLLTDAHFIECNFTNCKWEKKGHIIVRKGVIYDEIDFYKGNTHKTSLSNLEKVYRNLKAISKACEDRWMEGEFHYSENEIIMRRTKWYKRDGLSSRVYFYANRFGERPSQAVKNVCYIIVGSMLIYALSGIDVYNSNTTTIINYDFASDFHINWHDLWYLLAYALYPVSLNKEVGPANIFTYLFSILESALLVTQVGLFVNALRRKLQR